MGNKGLYTWQQRVAHVPQSIYLSDSSFAGNIALGVPEADVDNENSGKASSDC